MFCPNPVPKDSQEQNLRNPTFAGSPQNTTVIRQSKTNPKLKIRSKKGLIQVSCYF